MKRTITAFNKEYNIENLSFIKKILTDFEEKKEHQIFHLIDTNNIDQIKSLIKDDISILKIRDAETRTPLLYASFVGNFDVVKLIVEKYQNNTKIYNEINESDEIFGWNLFHYAVFGKNVEIFNYVLEKYPLYISDFGLPRDKFNWSPLDYLCVNESAFFKFIQSEYNKGKSIYKYNIDFWLRQSIYYTNKSENLETGKAVIIGNTNHIAGIISNKGSMSLFGYYVLYMRFIVEGMSFIKSYETPDNKILDKNIFYYYFHPLTIASMEGLTRVVDKVIERR